VYRAQRQILVGRGRGNVDLLPYRHDSGLNLVVKQAIHRLFFGDYL